MIETGQAFYGQHIGILVFSTKTPRIPGDAGNGESFSYQVRYEIVEGGFADLITGSDRIKAAILKAGQNLARLGIRAIIGAVSYTHLSSLLIDITDISVSSICIFPISTRLFNSPEIEGIKTFISNRSKEHMFFFQYTIYQHTVQGVE